MEQHTTACVAAPARLKETNSQFEADKALNSLEMVGCVASTRLPSTLAVKAPMMRTRTTFNTVAEALGGSIAASLLGSGAERAAAASVLSSVGGTKYQGMKLSSESSDDHEERELSLDESVEA